MKMWKNYVIKPLVLIGALNWGFIGAFNYDVLAAIFQNVTMLRIVDILIGLAAVACIVMWFMGKDE
ncbi:MAG: DUF378 domain-containing protein [Alphaproteobacteria bacterium]|nr:DUF378 domain-containing protein [Alphaproteobacteria bacterium]